MRLAALKPYLLGHRRKLAAGILSTAGSAAVGLLAPVLIGRAVDLLRQEISLRVLLNYSLMVLLVVFVQGLFTFAQRTLLVSMSRDIEFDLRNDYFRSLENLPLSFFQRNYTGDLMSRGTNDLQAVRMICGPAIMYGFNTFFTATGALIFMSQIHLRLTLLALATMPLVAVATQVFGARIHRLFEQVQEQFSALSTRVQENLSGLRVVRAYAQEEAAVRGFAELNRAYVERNRSLIRWTAAFHPLLQALVGVGFVAVLWYGGGLVNAGAVTVGEFVAFNFFLIKLIWPMIAIGWVINIVQRGAASLARIRRVMDSVPEVDDEEPFAALDRLTGEVRFDHLDFAYQEGDEAVLTDIDLTVGAGETVALVGRTGSGKSTLLALIPRLMNPPPKTLLVDGVDVRRLPLATLRAGIAAVPQETFLFSATIRDNIALGRSEADDEEILEAARLAGLGEDLAGLPDGLDTRVGERGITLSGGQKQRVALARALLRRPAILLLDDCLSAVDTETEEQILENLRTVFAGRTVFLVSHRISTVQGADQILVLEGGRIVERGTHFELLEAGGIFADLHRRQQLEEELTSV